MNDLALIAAVTSNIETILANQGWDFFVVQKDQPTQQGIPTKGTVFFELLFHRNYGTNATQFDFDQTQGNYVETETQVIITTFQISCLIPQDPTNTTLPTAKDVMDVVNRALGGRHGALLFREQNIATFRVTKVNPNWFEDDNHQMENHPTFDIELAHEGTTIWRTPASIGLEPREVDPFGSGTFPV
ncbi:hypothetical protein [Burkholderia phage vB_BglM_WTB]